MQDIRMDSHKLIYHPRRVAEWLSGKQICPVEIEMGISSACNHRCIFCAVDYMEYKSNLLTLKVLEPNMKLMGKKGVKSIIFAGEGEPLVNPEATEIINLAKKNGIDAAMSTNGVLFTEEKARYCLKSLTWVRFSIAGATNATYEKIHQCNSEDLQKALKNMENAVKVKRDQNLNVTLGAQLLLLPENKHEVVALAKIIREIGFDYFTVKPFSQHPSSKAKLTVDYSESEAIGKELLNYQTKDFKIYFRSQSIKNLGEEKPYDECAGMNFMTYIDATGNIYPCIVFMGRSDFILGNIYENTFDKIWESKSANDIRNKFDAGFIRKNCRKNCRLDEINKYLYALRHPGDHVNFI